MKYLLSLFTILIITQLISYQQISYSADWKKEFCPEEKGVCMIYEQNGSSVDAYLRNNFPYDDIITTVTLEHTGKIENLKSNTSIPLTVVFRGKKPFKAASFTILDMNKQWNTRLNWYWQYGSNEKTGNTKYPYSLPYEKGRRFRVCQAFNDTPTHHGVFAYSIDWLMPEGAPICAAREGIVISVMDQYDGGGFKKEYLNKNNIILILHKDGTVAQYAHIRKKGSLVKEGDKVKTGDTIAYSGNVGYSQSPHLHFAVSMPADGKKNMTIPVGFITDYSDYDILEKNVIYAYSGVSPKRDKPLVYMEDLVFCKRIVNYQPVDIAASFLPKDKFHVYVPISLKRSHKIGINFFKDNNPAPVLKYSWMLKKEWWQAITDVDLSKIPNPSGRWKVEIIIDNKTIGFKEFTVKNVP